MEVLHEEKQLRFFPWVNKQQEGREILVRGCSATRGERKKNMRGKECVFPFHSEVNYGWSVRGGMD